MAKAFTFISPVHKYDCNLGWSRWVQVEGKNYCVGVERGRRVRIAFKPSGKNVGYRWYGFVRNVNGNEIWSCEVCKSLGVKGLLTAAKLI